MKKLNVAVLFFGQPRFVDNKLAAISHRIWLRGSNVKYFGHCWYTNKKIDAYSKGVNAPNIKIPENAPSIIRSLYPGIQLITSEPLNFDPFGFESLKLKLSLMAKDEKAKIAKQTSVFLSQYYSISQALEIFIGQSQPEEFDYVVLSRYDNFILSIPKLKSLPKNKLIVNWWGKYIEDFVFIADHRLILGLNVQNDLDYLFETVVNNSPEEFKRAKFFKHFVQSDIHQIPMVVQLVRNNSLTYQLELLYRLFRYYTSKNYGLRFKHISRPT
jgi:hypothetical protein